jgi:hypothetical protein
LASRHDADVEHDWHRKHGDFVHCVRCGLHGRLEGNRVTECWYGEHGDEDLYFDKEPSCEEIVIHAVHAS